MAWSEHSPGNFHLKKNLTGAAAKVVVTTSQRHHAGLDGDREALLEGIEKRSLQICKGKVRNIQLKLLKHLAQAERVQPAASAVFGDMLHLTV